MTQYNSDDKYHRDLIQANINKAYQFDIKALLTYAHQHTLPIIIPLVGGVLFAFALIIVFVMLLLSIFEVTDPLNIAQQTLLNMQLLVTVFAAPIGVGLMLMGIRGAAKKNIKPVDIMLYFPRIFVLGLVSLFLALLIAVGFSLLVVPGIYLYIATTFVMPLIAERKCKPFAAFYLSIRMVNAYFVQFFILFILLLLAFVLCLLSYGLLLLYFLPFFFVLKGKIYIDLFGYGDAPDDIDTIEERKGDSTFDA